MSDTAGTKLLPSQQEERSNILGSDTRNILGVCVRVLDRRSAVQDIEKTLISSTHKKFAFLNAHGANLSYHDEDYRQVLRGFTVLADGIGVDLGSKFLYGEAFPENLNGTDFIPYLLETISPGRTVGLFGANLDVAKNALEVFTSNYPQHEFILFGDGYFELANEGEILGHLKSSRPDLLLVALGNPLQEKWIFKHISKDHAKVAIGVGALFDFTAGRVPRAPKCMIAFRIEWFFRLLLEPGRMWRRYVLGNPLFLFRILKQKLFGLGNRSITK